MVRKLLLLLLLIPCASRAQNAVQSGVGAISLKFGVPSGTLLVFSCKTEGSISSLTVTDNATGANFTEALIDSGHNNNVAVYYGVTTIAGISNVSATGCPNSYTWFGLSAFKTTGTVSVEETNSCYNSSSPSTCSITTTNATIVFSAQGAYTSSDVLSTNSPTIMLAWGNGSDAFATGYQPASSGSNTASYTISGSTGNDPLELVAFKNVSTLPPSGFQGVVQSGVGAISTTYSVSLGMLLIYSCKSESNISSLSLTDSTTGTNFSSALVDSGHSNNVAISYGTTTIAGYSNITVSGCPNNYTWVGLASFTETGTISVEETNSCYNGSSPSTCNITTTNATMIFSAQAGYSNTNTFTANYPTVLMAQGNGSDAFTIGYQYATAGSNTVSYTINGGTGNAPLELVAFINVSMPALPGVSVSKANIYAVVGPSQLSVSKANVYVVLSTSTNHPVSLTDTLSFSDSVLVHNNISRSIVETLSPSDVMGFLGPVKFNINENLQSSQALFIAVNGQLQNIKDIYVSDTLSTSDIITTRAAHYPILTENLVTSANVSFAGTKHYFESILENLRFSDSVSTSIYVAAFTTVSGTLSSPDGTYVGSFVRLELKNYGANAPYFIIGTSKGIIDPSAKEFHANKNGSVSFQIIGNNSITPTGTYYTITFFAHMNRYYSCNTYINGTSVSLNNLTCF